jgi:predicted transcriptional regulator
MGVVGEEEGGACLKYRVKRWCGGRMRDTVEVAAALVEACMKSEAAHSTLRRRVGLNHESFAVYVEACTAAGLIARTPNGRYSATQRGARFLELQRLREHHIREAETLTEALLHTLTGSGAGQPGGHWWGHADPEWR